MRPAADRGRKRVPIGYAEGPGDQFEAFADGDLETLGRECGTQCARHSFRLAEVAHESTFFIGERKRSGPALPTRSPMAEVRRIADTFTIPEGRRRRVYRPEAKFEYGRRCCQPGSPDGA